MLKLLKRLVLATALIVSPLAAQALASGPAGPAPQSSTLPGLAKLTAADAEAWLDGYMPYALKRGSVAGAVVVIVKDGQVLVEKGYGVSDTKTGAPVDPKKTLFRQASVSKLFTWTAVMQQVEAGKIDLDADVNKYIDFNIPPRDGKPITMRNLMTQTSGFEQRVKGILLFDPKRFSTLEHSLKALVPKRIFGPGEIPAYSNYGTALAGYIVQRVSGEDFNAYVENHIFKPLGMAHATFRQPLPASLAAFLSKNYVSADGAPQPFELMPMAPSGALSASGDDMGRFMIAHLSDGGPLMRPKTAQLMHATALQVLAPIDGITLGFFEEKINNVRGIGHAGDIRGFHSHLNLWPDQHVGLFISLNSDGRDDAAETIRSALHEGFADRYLPGTRTFPGAGTVDGITAAKHAALMASTNYIFAFSGFSSFYSADMLTGQSKVSVNDDGTITPDILNDMSGAPRRYREIAPYLWQQVGGASFMKANVVDGKVALWSVSEYSPAFTLIPVSPGKSSRVLLPLLKLGAIILLLTLIAWPVIALIRRRYSVQFPLIDSQVASYRVSRMFVLCAAAAMAGWYFITSKASGELEGLVWLSDNGAAIQCVEALTLFAFVGGLFAALWNAFDSFTHHRGWPTKLASALLVAAYVPFLWTFYAYGLVNFSTDF